MRRYVLVERATLERILLLARYSKVPFDASAEACNPRWMESVNLPSGDHLPTAATTESRGLATDGKMKEPPME